MARKIARFKSAIVQFCTGSLVGLVVCYLYSPDQHQLDGRLRPDRDSGWEASRTPVFVGIMSARKYLASRGCSVWRSWASDIVRNGGMVRFFVGSSDQDYLSPDCPLDLVVLEGVPDNEYPPQRKSFEMFRWIENHFGNTSYWFMRTDDDVFVNTDNLLNFLLSINSEGLHFLGQAGRGRGEEEGHLSLQWNENFCMGGTGMIMSRSTLQMFVPKIDTCLTNLLTNHEDVEIGRCVTLATGHACTWAHEMQNLFYHRAGGKDDKGLEIEPDTLSESIINTAITIHPIKSPSNMEKLALKIRSKKRLKLMTQKHKLDFQLDSMSPKSANAEIQSTSNNIPILDNLEDLPYVKGEWDFIFGHSLYSTKEGRKKVKVPTQMNSALNRIITQVVTKINQDARERGRTIEFRDLYYAYVKHDPEHGNVYILDILLVYKKFKGKKMTIKVRRHVFARESILRTHVRVREIESVPTPVPIVVPGDAPGYDTDDRHAMTLLFTISGDNKLSALQRFLQDYEREVLLNMQPVKLMVVLFRDSTHGAETENLLKSKVANMEKDYPGYQFQVVELTGQPFSRGVGLTTGLAHCRDTDLVFILDVDIRFTLKALDNVRRFVAEGKSVYFPIVFSEFKDSGGYWRDFGYGILAGYKKDIITAGGYNTNIKGWGIEDVDLYEKLLKSNITVIRSVDPNLVHKYHKVTCSESLARDQSMMCQTSRANTFLSLQSLYNLVLNSSIITP